MINEQFDYPCAIGLIENFMEMRSQGIVLNEFEHQLYEETARTLTSINKYKRIRSNNKLKKFKEGGINNHD